MPKIIITTGGTGGHIFPALATAEALVKLEPGVELLFVGATYGAEERLVKKAGIPFMGLPGRGILGKGIKALPAIYDNLKALWLAIKVVRAFNPCAIGAFGGYASFPAAIAGRLLGIPLLLHEQNAIAGTVNRLLGRMANTRCVSLPVTAGLRKPYVYTGNPVRQEISPGEGIKAFNQRHLLVLGGSQGAHSLNRHIVSILKELFEADVKLLHQTGEKDFEEVRRAYIESGYAGECVQPFINDMAAAYAWADLALCRSGASTIAELCIAGVPAILVPFPAAIHDHQTLNARALESPGAAIIVRETDLRDTGGIILSLLDNSVKLAEMSRAAYALKRPEAARLVAEEICSLCRTGGKKDKTSLQGEPE